MQYAYSVPSKIYRKKYQQNIHAQINIHRVSNYTRATKQAWALIAACTDFKTLVFFFSLKIGNKGKIIKKCALRENE